VNYELVFYILVL